MLLFIRARSDFGWGSAARDSNPDSSPEPFFRRFGLGRGFEVGAGCLVWAGVVKGETEDDG